MSDVASFICQDHWEIKPTIGVRHIAHAQRATFLGVEIHRYHRHRHSRIGLGDVKAHHC
jgi:hypothetical protein